MEIKTIHNLLEQIANNQICTHFDQCTKLRHYKCDDCPAMLHMDQVYLVQDIRRPKHQQLPYYLCAKNATEMQKYYEDLGLKADKHFIIRRLVK